MQARLGMPVDSTDGAWGELDDFVIDPAAWHLTHLVIQPHRHHNQSRLVPADAVSATTDRLTMMLSAAEIQKCPKVDVTEYIRVDVPSRSGNGRRSNTSSASLWPVYPYVGGTFGSSGGGFGGFRSSRSGPRFASARFDHIPAGELEIRRTSKVISSDHHKVGTVDGFVFDDSDQVTHLLLDHGHLWGHRDITIPIEHASIKTSSDDVHLDVARLAVGEFPSVRFHRHARVT